MIWLFALDRMKQTQMYAVGTVLARMLILVHVQQIITQRIAAAMTVMERYSAMRLYVQEMDNVCHLTLAYALQDTLVRTARSLFVMD